MTNEIMAAVINAKTNIVENVVVLGGVWQAPEGSYLVVTPEARIGDFYDKDLGVFVAPKDETDGKVE